MYRKKEKDVHDITDDQYQGWCGWLLTSLDFGKVYVMDRNGIYFNCGMAFGHTHFFRPKFGPVLTVTISITIINLSHPVIPVHSI